MVIKISKNRVDIGLEQLQNAELKNYSYTTVTANSGTSYTVDLSQGNVFNLTLTGNCTFTFTNPPASGKEGEFALFLTQDNTGSRTITWPTSVKWPNNSIPTATATAGATDWYKFYTLNAGTTWYGQQVAASFLPPQHTLWTWGYNVQGQLGLGDTTARSSPVQVGALTTWSSVAAGFYHTTAIKTDGTLWAWGYNVQGQLGLGDTVNRSSPVQVGTLTTWSSVANGAYHTTALTTSGTLWTWGYNAQGQLGLGDAINRSSPVQVGALTTWSSVANGIFHTTAITTSGTLWAWGYNAKGQLGLGDTTDRSSPVQVGALTTWSSVAGGGRSTTAIRST